MDTLEPISKPGPQALEEVTKQRVRGILEAGTAENTRLAYRQDLEYFRSWAMAALEEDAALPCSPGVLVKFITDHLEGLAPEVEAKLVIQGVKAKDGPHSWNTVKRRLASLSVAHEMAGVRDNPCKRPDVRLLLSKARKAAVKAGKGPKKKRAATLDLIEALIGSCGDEVIDIRDRALISVGFASGGRRRSELAQMSMENLEEAPGGYVYTLPFSKTDQEGKGQPVPIIGRAGVYLEAWLYVAGIAGGAVFRKVSKAGKVLDSGLTGHGIAKIIKKRATAAGLGYGNDSCKYCSRNPYGESI